MFEIEIKGVSKTHIRVAPSPYLRPQTLEQFGKKMDSYDFSFNNQDKYFTIPIEDFDVAEKLLNSYELKNPYKDQIDNLITERYSRKLKYFRKETFDYSILKPGKELKTLQKKDIHRLVKQSVIYNKLDAGLGKTLLSICWFSHFYKKGLTNKLLICIPPGLAYDWVYEFLDFVNLFKDEKDFNVISVENIQRPFDIDKPIHIIPYHLIAKAFYSYKEKNIRKIKKIPTVSSPVIDLNGKKNSWTLICDEAHNLRHRDSKQSHFLELHTRNFIFKTLLSATPATNHTTAWWSQLNILDPGIIGCGYKKWSESIALEIGDNYDPFKVKKYNPEKVKEFYKISEPFVISRLKKDDPDMTVKQFINPVRLKMSEIHEDIYNYIVKIDLANVPKNTVITDENFPTYFTFTILALENPLLLLDHADKEVIVNGKVGKKFPGLDKLLKKYKFEHDSKLEWLDYFIEEKIYNNDKVIIFDNHPLTQKLLFERYEKKKYKPLSTLFIRKGKTKGQDKSKEIFEMRRQFNKEKQNKIFILSNSSDSFGTSLQEGANNIVFYTMPTDTTFIRQGIDRTHRIVSVKDTIVKVPYHIHTYGEYQYDLSMRRIDLNDMSYTENIKLSDLAYLLNGKKQ